MLSCALKNSILLILIVLIIHFLIKNHLYEFNMESYDEKTKPIRNKLESVVEAAATIEKYEQPVNQVESVIKKQDDDLYKFVFEDMVPKSTSVAVEDNCKIPIGNVDAPKMVPTSGPLKQDFDKYMMINEYSDENIMNGGELFQGIKGMDTFESNFSQPF